MGKPPPLELRPVATILEAYLADLAVRAGLPRPGILSPDSGRSGRGRKNNTAVANTRSQNRGLDALFAARS